MGDSKPPPQANRVRFRFTIRGLFFMTAICGITTAGCVFMYKAANRSTGYGPYASFDGWPRALLELIGEDGTLRRDVVPYGLGQFFDHKSIWRIRAGSELQKALLDNNDLRATNAKHPKAIELMNSTPSSWGEYRWERCTWLATPGYGVTHIEGTDLYLIAVDPATGDLIVLHEWIF